MKDTNQVDAPFLSILSVQSVFRECEYVFCLEGGIYMLVCSNPSLIVSWTLSHSAIHCFVRLSLQPNPTILANHSGVLLLSWKIGKCH